MAPGQNTIVPGAVPPRPHHPELADRGPALPRRPRRPPVDARSTRASTVVLHCRRLPRCGRSNQRQRCRTHETVGCPLPAPRDLTAQHVHSLAVCPNIEVVVRGSSATAQVPDRAVREATDGGPTRLSSGRRRSVAELSHTPAITVASAGAEMRKAGSAFSLGYVGLAVPRPRRGAGGLLLVARSPRVRSGTG